MTAYAGSLVLLQVAMGLALFLYGMNQLESGIHTLGYSTFKRWLIRSTTSAAGSVSVGVGVTAVLQSSSMVSLLVLAFASAGVLPLINAVGVLLGANLGTTITGWMVATVGFKLSLQVFALPLMAGGALAHLVPGRGKTLQALGTLVFGIGLLIFGLDLMKSAVDGLAEAWDLALLRGHGPWLYFVAGAAIAALIQSSSATMMMTLAALNAGLFDLASAAALVIGADLGTTSTTALGSIGGHAIKRQLALAHVIFNLAVDIGAFFVLLPALPWLVDTLGLRDPLYALVAFHSLFNVTGLALFVPFLRPYTDWVGRRFGGSATEVPSLLEVPLDVPDAALAAVDPVLASLRTGAVVLSLRTFELSVGDIDPPQALEEELRAVQAQDLPLEERYHVIKHLESELLAFSMDLQARPLTPEQVSRLAARVSEARAIVYSCKTLKDVRHNLQSMRDSTQAPVRAFYTQHRGYMKRFYAQYLRRPAAASSTGEAALAETDTREEIADLLAGNEQHFDAANLRVREIAASDEVTGSELSNMLNVNREIHHAIKNLILYT